MKCIFHSLVHGRDTSSLLVLKYPDTQVHISEPDDETELVGQGGQDPSEALKELALQSHDTDPTRESELARQGVHSVSPRSAYEPAAQAVYGLGS